MTIPESIPIKFLLSAEQAQSTQWQWKKGEGELRLAGEQLTLTGRRVRPFMVARPQVVTFLRNQVMDVRQEGSLLYATVTMEDGKVEPLRLQFASDEMARRVAAELPTVRSGAALEQESFDQALGRKGVQVWVTPAMAGICVLVFGAMAVDGVPVGAPQGPELIPWGTNYGPRTLGGEPWRLYTSMFLHFGIGHLLLNMVTLLNFGPVAERLMGSFRFLFMYVASGLCGSMLSVLWNPMINSAGASGAIFGVLGATLAIMVKPRVGVPAGIAASSRKSALLFLGLNILNSFRPGIDMAAHLGGLGSGLLLGWFLMTPLPKEGELDDARSVFPGTVVAVALLAILGVQLFQPTGSEQASRAFRSSVAEFANAERVALARYNELLGDKRITDEERARRTLADVIPLWDLALDAALLVPPGTTRAERDLAVLLPQYAQGQILILQLDAEGILEKDRSKVSDSNKLGRKQDARRELVRSRIESL